MDSYPPFTVIVPTYNEEGYIEQCLNSILNSAEATGKHEILVVDGGSQDQTISLIKRLTQNKPNIRLIHNPKRIVPVSMNLGIHEAQYDFIFRVDGHAKVPEDFFAQTLEAAIAHPEAALVGGSIHSIHESIKGQAIALAQSCSFGVGNASFRTGQSDAYVDTLAFGVYRKEALDKVGRFDETFVRNQDDELSYRLIQAGYKIFMSSKVRSHYYTRDSLIKLWKQYSQYGYWKVKSIKKHRKPAALRHLIPAFFLISLLFSIPLSFFDIKQVSLGLIWFLMIAAPYSCLTLLFSLKSCLRHGFSYFPYLLFIFPILHLSYGWGFLIAILSHRKSSTHSSVPHNYVESSR